MDKHTSLKLFLGDDNRSREEDFCRTFSEKNTVSLVFSHTQNPSTNGAVITNDPQFLEIYDNQPLLHRVENHLGISPKVSNDVWIALSMVTRALSIHECLHILYTDFSISVPNDVKCRGSRNKIFVMHHIWNTIEDSFIESYGASYYQNIIGYLKFLNMSIAYSPDKQDDDEDDIADPQTQKQFRNLTDYLQYMLWFLIYSPFVKRENHNADIQPYINKTKDLFLKGSLQTTPKKRYEYVRKIFDIILPLIPDDDKADLNSPSLRDKIKSSSLNDLFVGSSGIKSQCTDTKPITRRIFTDLNGNLINGDEETTRDQLLMDIIDFEDNMARQSAESKQPVIETVIIYPSNYNMQDIFLHRNIKIIQNRKSPDFAPKNDYYQLQRKYQSVINTYKSRIYDILQAKTEVIVNRQIFGNGISSKHFGDLKKRYWYKKEQGIDLPPISFLFLIDGSGSMNGQKLKSAQTASLIMHEVLQANGIEHCFVEHRAGGEQPTIEVNVLFDFNSQPSQKYNLMTMKADYDNRDSLVLIWAEKYLSANASNEQKVIVVLSDGLPAHQYDHYYPPSSVEDTAITVNRIMHHGTRIAAIALCNTYNDLRAIYPNLVACDNLSTLPAQLFRLIAKMLE